jgi:hypothetical protein
MTSYWLATTATSTQSPAARSVNIKHEYDQKTNHIGWSDGDKKGKRPKELHHCEHFAHDTLALELGPRNARTTQTRNVDDRVK